MLKLSKKSKHWRVALLSSVICLLVATQVYLEAVIYPHMS